MMALSAKQLSRIEVERATPALPALIIMLALFLVSNFAYGGASRVFCPECRVFLAENETLHFRSSLREMGDFKIAYNPPKDPDSLRFDQEFYESMIVFLNAAFILPKDILVVFAECGQENAFYDPADGQIVMCHEFVEAVVNAFAFTELSDRE